MIPAPIPLVGLLLCGVVLAAAILAPRARPARKYAFVAVAVWLAVWATEKSEPTFRFSMGLADNGSAYDNAECVAVARWSAPAAFGAYAFKWTYYVGTNSHEQVKLPDGLVSDGTATAVLPVSPGEEVHFVCWAQYVAPVIVTTNGVYHLGGISRTLGGDVVPTNAPLKYVPFAIPVHGLADDGSASTLTPTNAPPAGSLLRAIYNEIQENEP